MMQEAHKGDVMKTMTCDTHWNRLSNWASMGFWIGTLIFTIAAPVLAEEGQEGGVESRGMVQGQRQPGGALTGQFRLPTWPQKFAVQGKEPASFGFAVTQPGPITVDVQAQGAPVQVTLVGPGSQPHTEAGAGSVRLTHAVTPQNIQQGLLWTIRIGIQAPPGQAPALQANGTIAVQAPPADPAAVQAQLAALSAQRQANQQRAAIDAKAKMDAAFQAHKADFERRQQESRAAAMAQIQPVLAQLQGRIGTRGIEGGATAAQEGSDVAARGMGTRGIEGGEGAAQAKEASAQEGSDASTRGIGTATMQFAPLISTMPVAVPTITKLSVPQGQPLTPVIIEGKNFGTQPASALFVISPSGAVSGRIEAWSDAMIVADVPDASGLFAYDGKMFVKTAAGNSNEVPFRFIPAQETRLISMTRDMVLAPPSGSGTTGDHVWHGPNSFWECFVGNKGNDVLFPTSRLKNGWTVQTGVISDLRSGSDWVWLVDSRPGTDTPYLNVRWSYDAFNEVYYTFGVYIAGPKGVPDGIVVP